MKLRDGVMLAAALVSLETANADSLFDPHGYRAFTSDNKAFRVGDVVTVQIVENSSATSSADTSSHRKSEADLNVGTVKAPNSKGVGIQGESDFDGGGKTLRSGRLLAQITTSVVGVAPSGELTLAGDQVLKVNGEAQKIHLDGVVRPEDISTGNVVPSTRLASAHIDYVGDGDLASRTRPSWWTRFLYFVGF